MYKLFLFLLFLSFQANAQKTPVDSTEMLENVLIKAYENNRKLIDVPAVL